MQLAERTEDGILVIEVLEPRVGGDVSTAFQEAMASRLDQGETRLVLNLARVDFIDSMGLGAIIQCRIRLGKNGEMVLCGLNEHVRSVFRFTRMDKVFRMFPGEPEAIAALRGGES